MEGNGFQSRGTAPVKVGDELEVTIESVGAKGDGVAKKEGFVIFVPGVQKGDNVRVKVTRVLRKVGFGEVVGSAEGGGEEAPADEGAAEEAAPEEDTSQEGPAEDSEDFGEEKQ